MILLPTTWAMKMPEFIIKCSYEKLFTAEVNINIDDEELNEDRIISGELEEELLELDENEEIEWTQVGETSFEYSGNLL